MPPGVGLEAPQAYEGITGDGELWLDAGLPLRQIVRVTFAPQGDYRLRADMTITFDFARGGTLAARPDVATGVQGAASAPLGVASDARASAPLPRLLTIAAVVAAVAVAALLASRGARSRRARSQRAHATLAMFVILAMIATPLLQADRVVAFSEGQRAREQSRLEEVEREGVVREAQEALASDAWNPHRDPLARGTAHGLDETAVVSETLSVLPAERRRPHPLPVAPRRAPCRSGRRR